MFKQLDDPTAESFSVFVDGQEVRARDGDTVAAVLLRIAPFIARKTPVRESPRAPYCMMGVCFDCLATVDGKPSVQTCLVPAEADMRIERGTGRVRVAG